MTLRSAIITGTASININGTVGATTPSTGAFTTLSATGVISTTDVTDATSSTVGSLKTAGGIAAAKALNIGLSASMGGTLSIAQASAGSGFILIGPPSPSSNDNGYIEFRNSNGVKNWKIGHNLTVGGSTFEFIPSTTNGGSTYTTPAVTISSTGVITSTGTISPQQATTAGAPAYVKGAIYFDITLNKLRVGGATAWETINSV